MNFLKNHQKGAIHTLEVPKLLPYLCPIALISNAISWVKKMLSISPYEGHACLPKSLGTFTCNTVRHVVFFCSESIRISPTPEQRNHISNGAICIERWQFAQIYCTLVCWTYVNVWKFLFLDNMIARSEKNVTAIIYQVSTTSY